MNKSLRWSLLVCAFSAVSIWTIQGSNTQHVAHLSDDLGLHLAQHSSARVRVIVTGSDAALDAIAARHHVGIIRRLDGGGVVLANSAELSDLAADGAVSSLSGDAEVRPWMSVSNPSTAADQTRAGTNGLL